MDRSARRASQAGSIAAAFVLLVAICCLPSGNRLLAQPDAPGGAVDTTETAGADTAQAPEPLDTIPPFEPHGAPLGSVRPDRQAYPSDLTKADLPAELYFSLFEPLREKLPAYPLSHGAPGLLETFSYAGADPGAITTLFNGRPLAGSEEHPFDPGLYPPEFIERVEVLRGAEAAVFGDAASLIGLNAVQPRFNVAGSYMRIVFGQGGGNTSSADLTFARNVASRTNLTVGVRRLTSDGVFDNQEVSQWNIRGALTWRPMDGLTVSLAELFSDLTRGANGGLTPASSLAETVANSVNDTLNENRLRHDLSLSAQWYPGLAGEAITDTTDLRDRSRFDGSVYYTHAGRGLTVAERPAELPGVPVEQGDDVFGVRGGAYLPLGGIALHGNLVAELTDGKAGKTHAGGMVEIPVGETLGLFGGGAVTSESELTTLSFFGEGRVAISDSFDLRLSARIFSDNAAAVSVPSRRFSAQRSRMLLEAEGRWRRGAASIAAGGHIRRVAANPTAGNDYWIAGAHATVGVPIAFLILEQSGLLTIAPSHDKRFPLLLSHSDLYALFSLFGGNLDLRIGTSLEYQSPFAGTEYNIVRGTWLYPSDRNREEELFPMLDAYARARIGSAYLKVTLSNILDVEYFTAYRYPVWGRSLQIGLTWALID